LANNIRRKRELPEAGVVTIACKMPRGLILRVFEQVEVHEPVLGGGTRLIRQSREIPNAPRVVVNGNAVPFGRMPKFRIVGGYALTEYVDAQFWKKWWEQNQELELVKNNLIFACDLTEDAVDKAEEMAETHSGLEPLNPEGDYRKPRAPNKNVGQIEQAELE
jgi:hypothetical protein